jgi:hypothetical protein
LPDELNYSHKSSNLQAGNDVNIIYMKHNIAQSSLAVTLQNNEFNLSTIYIKFQRYTIVIEQ